MNERAQDLYISPNFILKIRFEYFLVRKILDYDERTALEQVNFPAKERISLRSSEHVQRVLVGLIHAFRCCFQLVVHPKDVLPLSLWVRFGITKHLHKFRCRDDFAETSGGAKDIVTDGLQLVLPGMPDTRSYQRFVTGDHYEQPSEPEVSRSK